MTKTLKKHQHIIIKQEPDIDKGGDDDNEKTLDAIGSLRRTSHIRPKPSIKCDNTECSWIFKNVAAATWCPSSDDTDVLRCPSCQQLTRVPTFVVTILTNNKTVHVDTVRLYSQRATIEELRFAYRNFRWTSRTKVATIMDQLAKYDHDLYWNVVHYGIKVKSINK